MYCSDTFALWQLNYGDPKMLFMILNETMLTLLKGSPSARFN